MSATLWQRGLRSASVAWMLAQRELVAEYHMSRMSLAWPILYPLAYTALFVLMRPMLAGHSTASSVHYALFVFVGFSLWQSWFEAMRGQMDAIRRNKSLMARAELGAATLFVTTTLVAAIHMAPRVLLAIIAALIFLPIDAAALSWLVFGSIFVLLNGAAIGALLQPFSTLSPDLGKAIQSISLALLITGAVFIPLPPAPSRVLLWLVSLNPLGALLNAARAPLLGESLLVPWASLAWVFVTLLLTAMLLVVGRRLLPILIERIGN